jgi:hypothetical protein
MPFLRTLAGGLNEGRVMTTKTVEMERFSVVSSKPFQEILMSLKSAVGRFDMAECARATKSARTFAELGKPNGKLR